MKAGHEFELLIEKIYKDLSPEAKVVRNDKIFGHDSGIKREIDLSVRTSVATHEILILIQAKDYKTKADINVVGEFITVIKDTRASKGILICNAGFTEGAIKLAKNQGIDICTAHDASSIKWKLELKIPILLKAFSKYLEMKFKLKSNQQFVDLNKDRGVQINIYFNKKDFSLDDGQVMYSLFELLKRKSGTDFTFSDLGEHCFDLFENNLKFKIEGIFLSVEELKIKVVQRCNYYLKYVDADEYRGINHILANNFNPTHLSFKTEINKDIPDDTWQKIESESLAITPITLVIESDFALNEGQYEQKVSKFSILKEQG